MSDNLLCCQGLDKSFGKTQVLKDINLEVRHGEIFGLLGLNGVGKSTLIKCILQLFKYQKGSITFEDRPIRSDDIQKYFGFLPENFSPYGNLSARELLSILAWGVNVSINEVDVLLESMDLKTKQHVKVKSYSRGMIQRLGLAMSMLKKAKIIILDEPTLGLDPIGQICIINILKDLKKEGCTIFFTSHILSQVEEVCDRIGVIKEGTLSFTGTVSDALEKHKTSCLQEAFLKEVGFKESEQH